MSKTKKSKINIFGTLIAGIISGALLTLAFPGFNIYFFAFFALVPIIIIIESQSFFKSIVAILSFVVSFYVVFLWWIKVFHIFALPGLIVYLCIIYSLTVILYRFLRRSKGSIINAFIFASIFCTLEYLRNLGFVRFPYGIIAYSQYSFKSLIQISDITSYLGISFILYFSNALIANTIVSFYKTKRIWTHGFNIIFRTLILTLIITSSIIYGNKKLEEKFTSKKKEVKVSVIQPWYDYNLPWNDFNIDLLYRKLTTLTLKAMEEKPDLVVWPESSINDFYKYNTTKYAGYDTLSSRFQLFFKALSKTYNRRDIKFLSGGAHLITSKKKVKFKQAKSAKDAKTSVINSEEENIQQYNSALFINHNGRLLDWSGKKYLVGFAEYFPFPSLLEKWPLLKNMLEEAEASNFTPYKDLKIFNYQDSPFSTLICYEDCFSNFSRNLVLKGATFLVVITNDAWSYSRKAQTIHYSFAVFRAIENRRAIVRSGNAGISGIISPLGNLSHSLPMFEEGFKTFPLKPLEKLSFYSNYGDLFIYLIFLMLLLVFLPLAVATTFFKKIIP